jgi:hypothetical protein
MTLAARRLWVVCKTFNVLPNDPLVAGLNSFQIEWILWNLVEEAKAMDKVAKGGRGGRGTIEISDARGGAALGLLRGASKKR